MKSLLFTQSRLGLHRKPFTIFKFRTMVNGKVTRFGSILRATGIDELPQLWNIVKGDMRFIGPRPLTQEDVNRLKWNSSEYDKRFSVRPGMTGFAQLSPICDPKNTLTQDHKTIDEKSAFNIFKILLLSIAITFLGKTRIKNITFSFQTSFGAQRRRNRQDVLLGTSSITSRKQAENGRNEEVIKKFL